MQYATLDGRKSMPSHTGQRADCPSCRGEMLSKCGEIVVHHWAHLSGKDCDPWAEQETLWHREWKNQFPSECREVTIYSTDSDEYHRADVCLPNGTVLEFQHSSLTPKDIRKREDFYKRYANGVVWIVDGSEFMDRWVKLGWTQWAKESYLRGKKGSWFMDYSPFNYVYDISNPLTGFSITSDGSLPDTLFPLLKPVRWPHTRKSWAYANAPLYFDSGERSNKPEMNLVHEKEGVEFYTDQEPKKLKDIKEGESQYKYTEKNRKFYTISEEPYQESDIFEWLGTVNDGAATSKGFSDKLSRGFNSRVNGRETLHLPKYIIGRFKPFDNVLSELNS